MPQDETHPEPAPDQEPNAASESEAEQRSNADPAPGYEPDYAPGPRAPESPPAPRYYPQPPHPGTNGFAIAALVVGIAGLFFCFGAIAIILGNIANRQIETTHENGRGMANAGIILGILAIVLALVRAFLVFVLGDWMTSY